MEASSQSGVDVSIKVPFGMKLGTYHFQVIATSGTEKHIASFVLSIVAHLRPGTPRVLIHQNISGYHFDLSDSYGGSVTEGIETSFVYAVTPLNNSSLAETYAMIQMANSKFSPLHSEWLRSDAPQQLTLNFTRAGNYTITMWGAVKQPDGDLKVIGSAKAPFVVEAKPMVPFPIQTLVTVLVVVVLALAGILLLKSPGLNQAKGLSDTVSRRIASLFVLFGVAVLLALPFLAAYSYETVTKSTDLKTITITYVYPFAPFTLSLIFAAVGSLAFGLYELRDEVRLNSGRIGFLFAWGIVLSAVSLVTLEHVVAVEYEAYELVFPFPWMVASANLWLPSPVVVYDVLFWVSVAYLASFLLRARSNITRRS